MRDSDTFSVPNKDLIRVYFKWLLIVLGVFFTVYYSTNYYATSISKHYHLYMDWELSIPLFPPMIIIYTSYMLIFAVVPFVFNTQRAFHALGSSMLVVIMISGLVFLLFPGHLGFVRQDNVPGYELMFSVMHAIDHPHNLFPSLHVTFACLCVLGLIHQTGSLLFHNSLKLWFALVCVSVVLVHQHHVFDIICGIALGWAVHSLVFKRVVNGVTLMDLSIESFSFKALDKVKGLLDK